MSTTNDTNPNAAPVASPSAFGEEIMLMAEKIGELSDRFGKIEGEFATQTAPLDGARAAQDASLVALKAALTGIEQLNFHVLQNNLEAVTARIVEADKEWKAKAQELAETIGKVDSALVEVASQLRQELSAGAKLHLKNHE